MSIKDMKILDFSIFKNRQFSKLSSGTTHHQIFESIKNNETFIGSWLCINSKFLARGGRLNIQERIILGLAKAI